MPLKKEVILKYMNPVFLETGSLVGESIQLALDVGFEKVLSVELAEKYFDICLDKFKHNSKVNLYFGDVELVLWDMINFIDAPITFWLDAHHSGADTALGIRNDPIIQEINIIKRHHRKDHTILVDDLKGMDAEAIKSKLLEINPSFQFSLEDGFVPNDILVARL